MNDFNKELQNWLMADEQKRDYAQGAKLLLQLTGNQIMYRNMIANPRRYAKHIEYQLQKRLKFRLAKLTHDEVEAMQREVDSIAEKRNLEKSEEQAKSEFKKGKRADHDALPDEVQALYVENLSLLQRMRELHLKLRTLSLENASCPDSERFPFLKELITLDKRMHANWQQYDTFTGTDGEELVTAEMRAASKRAIATINVLKTHYRRKPTEEMAQKIRDNYAKAINPPEKLSNELREMGIIE